MCIKNRGVALVYRLLAFIGEYRKSCVNKSFRDKIKNIKEGFFLWVKK